MTVCMSIIYCTFVRFQDLTTGKTCYRCSVDVVPTSPVSIGPYLHYAALEAKVDHKILTFSIPYLVIIMVPCFDDALPVGEKTNHDHVGSV